ncbi:hypothetical protein Cs7R123_78130 [Catellatospora sp. TT07R-123]|uniref:FG-GAP repeat protein n=1 Tax=Catellatospora sp. TT07R-123 TaxID=2733863 RepID=UPI001B03EF36|nr:FG-GAP repeat protein [Catellatospora sp. TT07R-123]GHJ50471.1 hypothetical protein Cs7R123_78130 [Catellatospora sp. TT07R-123]
MRRALCVLGVSLLGLTGATAAGAAPAAPGGGPRVSPNQVQVRRPVLLRRIGQTPPASTGTPQGAARWDFDGDGRDEIAVAGDSYGGTVIVSYSRIGARDVITIDRPYQGGGEFGTALAGGDFDGDGYDDLVVGDYVDTALRQTGSRRYAAPGSGSVWIIPGGTAGLRLDRAREINRDTVAGLGQRAEYESFGSAVATGDLNRDGYDDLAVGAPTANGLEGGVAVVYGGRRSLGTSGTWLDQDTAGVPDTGEHGMFTGDYFGAALAIGDATGDGYADLAVGAPGEDGDDPRIGTGAITLLKGSAAGLTTAGATQVKAASMATAAQPRLGLGRTLAVVDLNRDGAAEVVSGSATSIPTSLGGVCDVVSLVGRAGGLSTAGAQIVKPAPTALGDGFGSALATGDVTGDGYPDLVVGAPGRTVAGHPNAGAVYVVPGSAGRLTGAGIREYTQDTAGISDTAEQDDEFGHAVAVLNRDGDGTSQVLVGAYREWIGGEPRPHGLVTVLRGGTALTELTTWTGAQLFPAPPDGDFGMLGVGLTGSRLGYY